MADKDKDVLQDARDAFEECSTAATDNNAEFLDDIKFGRLGEQWDKQIQDKRRKENRPCLTINRMPAFMRQVTNDVRQNRPQIKIHPVDSNADVETAKTLDGLVRHIQYSSDADVAYDTATDFAVSGGFGYIRVDVEYAYDDSFDKDLKINRVADPLTITGDCRSKAADSSDWCVAFVQERMDKDDFEQDFPKAEPVDWKAAPYASLEPPWRQGEDVLVCEYWTRSQHEKTILLIGNNIGQQQTVDEDVYAKSKDLFDALGMTVQKTRTVMAYKVTQRLITGAEVLSKTEWAGQYIPIIPVYGEEVMIEGRRHFRSLIRDAKDAQRMFNYWRSASTELVALAPKAPFIGEEGAFDADENWKTANTESHPYLFHAKGTQMPQRQPFAGQPAGAVGEALAMADDMKAILGIYDASLGQRSNETSGRAIMARQREGDVSTFHFIDNLTRAIRHTGRVLVDLIPHVYTGPRVIRIMGYDGKAGSAVLRSPAAPGEQPQPQQQAPQQQPQPGMPGQQPGQQPQQDPGPMQAAAGGVARSFDLTTGKYDVTVESGPSFTTRREEAMQTIAGMIQAAPEYAPVLAPELMKVSDWPGADELSVKMEGISQGQQQAKQAEAQNLAIEGQAKMATAQAHSKDADTRFFDAQTKRMQAIGEAQVPPNPVTPEPPPDPLEQAKTAAEIDHIRAQTDQVRAQAQKTAAETSDTLTSIDATRQSMEAVDRSSQSNQDMGSLMGKLMEGLHQVAETHSQAADRHAQAAERMAQAMEAPRELQVDQRTGRKRSVVVRETVN